MAAYRTSVDADYIVNEYLGGKSSKQLSDELGVGRRVINRRLKDNGVAIRGRSEAELLKWSRMDTAARARQVAAANEAVRGRTVPYATKCLHAKTVQKIHNNVSPIELKVLVAMKKRGITMHQQTAIGPYNCDFTVGSIAVEVYGGKWHWGGRHLARTEERFRHIMNAGYDVLVLAIYDPFPFTPAVADYLARQIKRLRRNPPAVRQYRVVWGAGEFTTGGCLDDDEISIEPPFTRRRDPRTGRYERIPR